MAGICFGSEHDDQMTGRFSYASLQTATKNFSEKRVIGEGSYARVYRGNLAKKTAIAVKNYQHIDLNRSVIYSPEFSHVLEVLSCIRHPNIHRVLGYCMEINQVLVVSEYVDNGTLLDLILDQKKRESVFNWHMRLSVCIGIATGLSYLHEDANPHIIHRDIKPENILLDKNFTPKITDFDYAQLFCDSIVGTLGHVNEQHIHTLPSNTCVMGSQGYVALEHINTGELTEKLDVYSFGIVMLEVVSGRLAPSFKPGTCWGFIAEWASALKQKGRVLKIVDSLLTDFQVDDVCRFIDVALLCTKAEPKLRPSMREVVQMLDGSFCSIRFRRSLDVSTTDDTSYTAYLSAASSFRSSIAETSIVDEGESSAELNANSTEIVTADSETTQGEVETSAAQEQSNGVTYSEVPVQQSVIILSGSGDLVERLSQPMVFKKHPRIGFPEAVYPPFRTRVFQRNGSRNLYTF